MIGVPNGQRSRPHQEQVRDFSVALVRGCPTCGVVVGQPCVPSSMVEPHLARFVSHVASECFRVVVAE